MPVRYRPVATHPMPSISSRITTQVRELYLENAPQARMITRIARATSKVILRLCVLHEIRQPSESLTTVAVTRERFRALLPTSPLFLTKETEPNAFGALELRNSK